MGAPEQFHRAVLMLGESGVDALRSSCVMVVGLGAVGGYAVEGLARAGVGRFRLVDFDRVQESNLNRQLLATHRTIGLLKADLARERIAAINPDAVVETKTVLVNEKTMNDLFSGEWSERPDFVVDAIDSLGPKVGLIAELVERRLPFISSMGAALRFNADLVRLGTLDQVVNCPLAKQVRKRLRRLGVDPKRARCVYSPEPIRAGIKGGREVFQRVEASQPLDALAALDPPGRKRNTLGSLPTVVGMFGLRIAHEIILELSGATS